MARRSAGFTLIELMIVLIVAAVILVIAIPAFNAQMRKSKRSEGQSQLEQMALLEEQWRAGHSLYGTYADLGSPTLTHYDLSVAFDAVLGNDGTNYTVTATAKSGDDQNNDTSKGTTCTPMSITFLGGAVSKSPTNCW